MRGNVPAAHTAAKPYGRFVCKKSPMLPVRASVLVAGVPGGGSAVASSAACASALARESPGLSPSHQTSSPVFGSTASPWKNSAADSAPLS